MQDVPFIGICVGVEADKVHDPNYKLLMIRLGSYEGKRANFIKFTLDQIDMENRTVHGDLLLKEEKGLSWKEGVYPLPMAIYMQCRFRKEDLAPFLNKGIEIFNSAFFDKIDNMEFFKRYAAEMPLVPYTKVVGDAEDIENYLLNRDQVFLKPVNGFSGRGIVFAEKQEDGMIKASYHLNRKSEEQFFRDCREMWKWIQESYCQDSYVLQQNIGPVKKRGMPTDLRLNMNRNEKGEWEVIRLFGRSALNGTHMGSKKGIHFITGTLSSLLSERYTKKAIEGIEQKIMESGFKICDCFEKDGEHMADLGIDFIIDNYKRLWIIEINTFPSPAGHDRSVTLPLEYAYYLASGKDGQ